MGVEPICRPTKERDSGFEDRERHRPPSASAPHIIWFWDSTDAKPINTRFIAATHRDLKHDVDAGAFRSDLYYRLNVFPIKMPPLRERKVDIPLLVTGFRTKHADS